MDTEIARHVTSLLQSYSDDDADQAIFRLWKRVTIENQYQVRSELATLALSGSHSLSQPGPIRVLYVSNASAFSGAEESLCQLIAHVDRARFQPFALVGKHG